MHAGRCCETRHELPIFAPGSLSPPRCSTCSCDWIDPRVYASSRRKDDEHPHQLCITPASRTPVEVIRPCWNQPFPLKIHGYNPPKELHLPIPNHR